MFDVTRKSIEWGEETLTLETGKVARQADGTVIATLGETSVMANVTFAKEMKEGQDFFPLTVHYQEKYYAAGKIPGGFFKREARPSEAETLTARLIDRPIRPLFVEGFKHEVLVMCTVLSHDLVNSPDVVAMIAASAALTLSGVPFMGPIAAARVGFENGDYILNPTVDDMQGLRNNPDQRLDLVVAGTKDAVMMVESEAYGSCYVLGAPTIAAALTKSSPKKSPAISRFYRRVCIIRGLGGDPRQHSSQDVAPWLGGRVVMQRIANPSTPVRFRPEPPIFEALSRS